MSDSTTEAAAVPTSSASAPASNDGSAPANTSFEAQSSAPREEKSGEALLLYAYAFIWVAVLAFVAIAWRRTRALEGRLAMLESAIEKARGVPPTKPSADKRS